MKSSSQQGAFLVTVILLITVLTMMALAFTALATRDSGFARLQEDQAIAEETARSGIEYYLAYGLPHDPVALDPDHPERLCRLEIKNSYLYSHGELGKGKRAIRRTLCAPLWDLARVRSTTPSPPRSGRGEQQGRTQ